MNAQDIVSGIKGGVNTTAFAKAVACLYNFDAPLTEREAEAVRVHVAELAEGSSSPQPIAQELLSKPSVAIPRATVFACIGACLRNQTLAYATRRALAADLLPSVVLKSYPERTAQKRARLTWIAQDAARDTANKKKDASAANAAVAAHASAQALVDVAGLEATLGSIGAPEWIGMCTMLKVKGDWADRGFLRVMEEVAVVLGSAAGKAGAEALAEAVKTPWCEFVAKLVAAVGAARVTKCRKDGRKGLTVVQQAAQPPRACFLGTATAKRLGRFLAQPAKEGGASWARGTVEYVVGSCPGRPYAGAFALLLQAAAAAATKNNSGSAATAVAAAPLPSFQVFSGAIKAVAGSVVELLGSAPAAGSVQVADPSDCLQYSLQAMGQSATTWARARDHLALMQGLPTETLRARAEGDLADLVGLLYGPFITNNAVFSPERSSEIAGCFGRCFARKACPCFRAQDWSVVCQVTTQTIQNRCRSGVDRIGVLTVFAGLLRAQAFAGAPMPEAAEVFGAVKMSLECGAILAMGRAWEALAQVPGSSVLTKDHAAIKNMGKNADSRAMCLEFAAADFDLCAGLWQKLQLDAADTALFRPLAVLSLRLSRPKGKSALGAVVQHCAGAASIRELTGHAAVQGAHAAVACAEEGNYHLLAAMLTHGSGDARLVCRQYVEGPLADDAVGLSELWAALTTEVFGLRAESRPPICSDLYGAEALVTVVRALLPHVEAANVVTVLTDAMLCCGHDHVVGEDVLYFKGVDSSPGQYRGSSVRCSGAAFRRAFKGFTRVLEAHDAGVAGALCSCLTSADHIASAAGRALGMLLTRHSARRGPEEALKARESANIIFRAILGHLERSVAFFGTQDELDTVIASDDEAVMREYVHRKLKDQGLVKEYTKKLSKGQTEEDLESQKKKDDKALAEGRAKVQASIAKRTATIQGTIRANASPFAALRTIGYLAPTAIEGLSVVYPFVHSTLVKPEVAMAAKKAAMDACVGLLHHSPVRNIAKHFVSISVRLANPDVPSLTSGDIRELVAVAAYMRQYCSAMLPPALFSVLQPFIKGAFKAGRGGLSALVIPSQAQFQLMAILNMNTAQADIPHKSEACSLYINIIAGFPTLYKSVLAGLGSLVAHCNKEEINPLIKASFRGSDLQRECAFATLAKFQQYRTFRMGLVVSMAMAYDASVSLVHVAEKIQKTTGCAMEEGDLEHLLSLLEEFGTARGPAALRNINKAIVKLLEAFPVVEGLLVAKLVAMPNTAPVVTLGCLAGLLSTANMAIAMDFLCGVVESTTASEATLHAALATGRALLQSCEKGTISTVAPTVQTRLQAPPTAKIFKPEHKEIFAAVAVVWLTIIACKMGDTAFLEQTIAQQKTVLEASTSIMVHGFVQEALYEIASQPSMKKDAALLEFGAACLKGVIEAPQYVRKRAFAAGLVGVCQGLGVQSIKTLGVMAALEEATKGKQAQRSGIFVVIETLADGLGRLFEPYALTTVPRLLEGVGEKDSKVSDCADDAAKAVMRNMSEVGLHQLIPKLVVGLESDQTKKRTPSLSFIGYVAFCSPKQLAHALPQIMVHVCSCLFDANSSVSNAAYLALKRVAGVVSNNEIKEHVDSILAAMRNPTTETENALDALLYTRFMTTVDPASLALVVPVVIRGLDAKAPSSKGKASQIVAAMVQLVGETRSLLPYSDELLHKMQHAAQDPQNDVRSTASKAIAALASTIGGDFLERAYGWCFQLLDRAETSAEKAGAAQVVVEITNTAGKHMLFNAVDRIDRGMHSTHADVRDGFLHLMIYAPATLPHNIFQEFLPMSFPWVLEGLSDINEKVRTTALTAGSNIIVLYGSRNLPLVLKPLLDGVMSEDTNQRRSSLLLTAKLLIHLVTQIKKKLRIAYEHEQAKAEAEGKATAVEEVDSDDDVNGEDADILHGGEVQMETARDAEKRGVSLLAALEEELGPDNFIRVLAAMHVGRNETNSVVRGEIGAAWQIAVASARTAINKVFKGIVMMLVKFASSDNIDCVELASKTVEYTCARLNENVEKFISLLADQYKTGTKRHEIGALVCMTDVIPHADAPRVMAMGGEIIACVLPSLQAEDEEVRSCAGNLFEQVSKKVGARLIESVVESQIDGAIIGVLEVIKVRPSAAVEVVYKILDRKDKDLTADHMDLLVGILDTEAADEVMIQHQEDMVVIVLRAIRANVEGALEAMTALAGYLEDLYVHLPLQHFTSAAKSPATKLSAILAAGAYARGVSLDEAGTQALNEIYRLVIGALADGDETVSHAAAQLLIDMNGFLDQRVVQDTLSDAAAQDLTTSRRAAGRYSLSFLDTFQQTLGATGHSSTTSDEPEFVILSFPKLFESIQAFYLRVLEHGHPADRVQAIDALQGTLEFTPVAIKSAAVSTISGKCSKALFTRQDGSVIAAILKLCLKLLSYPAGGKERMVESTLSIAMVGALLCESSEARALVHQVTITILKRNPAQASAILGSVVSKKSAIDSAILKGAVCRFISVVLRYGKLERSVTHAKTLCALVKPWWERPESASVGTAAGVAVGALCMNAAIPDDEVASICDRAVAMAQARSTNSQAGISAVYSIFVACGDRIDDSFRVTAAEAVRGGMGFVANDRLASLWIMRCAGIFGLNAATKTIIPGTLLEPLLKKITDSDELMLSAALFAMENVHGGVDTSMMLTYPVKSTMWVDLDAFDADVDDESQAHTFY